MLAGCWSILYIRLERGRRPGRQKAIPQRRRQKEERLKQEAVYFFSIDGNDALNLYGDCLYIFYIDAAVYIYTSIPLGVAMEMGQIESGLYLDHYIIWQ